LASEQPIVIIGGFLAKSSFYKELYETLIKVSGQPVFICSLGLIDWIRAVNAGGWLKIMAKLHGKVKEAAKVSATGKIILVGHSSGGVISRLYLGPDEFLGKVFKGLDYVSHLITLGSPHYNLHGAKMRKYVQKIYPDSYFYPKVKYFCVAGAAVQGDRKGSILSRISYYSYKFICGRGDVKGDGLVPVESALLRKSEQLILDGVDHPFFKKRNWYGNTENVSKWWYRFLSTV